MNLDVIIDDEVYTLNVPEALIEQATDFFDKMDKDMDAGWQMGQAWVETLNQIQRSQIVADKLYSAIDNKDDNLGRLMAGYICHRMPDIEAIELDPQNDINSHRFTYKKSTPSNNQSSGISFATPTGDGGLSVEDMLAPKSGDMEADKAQAQAEKEISSVYKTGRHYRFSMLNRMTGEWVEAAAVNTEEEAQEMRAQVVKSRYYELSGQR